MNSDGSSVRLLTSSPVENFAPQWSPDGTRLLFLSNRAPRNWWTMYVISVDGSGERQLAGDEACPTNVSGPRWSHDGARIAYACDDNRFGGIFTIRADGTQPTLVSTSSPGVVGFDIGPVWSPDGRQLAFTRFESEPGTINSPGQSFWRVHVVDLSTSAVTRVSDGPVDVVYAWGAAR
jgi:Tol biopolymer transport system component